MIFLIYFEFFTICIVQNVQTYLNALNKNKTNKINWDMVKIKLV